MKKLVNVLAVVLFMFSLVGISGCWKKNKEEAAEAPMDDSMYDSHMEEAPMDDSMMYDSGMGEDAGSEE